MIHHDQLQEFAVFQIEALGKTCCASLFLHALKCTLDWISVFVQQTFQESKCQAANFSQPHVYFAMRLDFLNQCSWFYIHSFLCIIARAVLFKDTVDTMTRSPVNIMNGFVVFCVFMNLCLCEGEVICWHQDTQQDTPENSFLSSSATCSLRSLRTMQTNQRCALATDVTWGERSASAEAVGKHLLHLDASHGVLASEKQT